MAEEKELMPADIPDWVREAEEAKEKVDNRIKKLLLSDLSKAG